MLVTSCRWVPLPNLFLSDTAISADSHYTGVFPEGIVDNACIVVVARYVHERRKSIGHGDPFHHDVIATKFRADLELFPKSSPTDGVFKPKYVDRTLVGVNELRHTDRQDDVAY